jgi:hypothetical protein
MSEAQNGSAPALPHAAAIVQQLRDLIDERRVRLNELDEERNRINGELKIYEQAIKPLTGEPTRKRKAATGERIRTVPSKVGPERLAEIEEFIRAYAAEHEEFRQVDIRAGLGTFKNGSAFTSSQSASAFEALRQEPHNLLRVARVSGNSKYYRLTREALQS